MGETRRFYKGQKVKHTKAKEVLTVVRDEGGVKVVVRDSNGNEISVLRSNLEVIRDSGSC